MQIINQGHKWSICRKKSRKYVWNKYSNLLFTLSLIPLTSFFKWYFWYYKSEQTGKLHLTTPSNSLFDIPLLFSLFIQFVLHLSSTSISLLCEDQVFNNFTCPLLDVFITTESTTGSFHSITFCEWVKLKWVKQSNRHPVNQAYLNYSPINIPPECIIYNWNPDMHTFGICSFLTDSKLMFWARCIIR